MITNLRAAEICAALYGVLPTATVVFSYVDDGEDDGVVWAVAHEGDTDVVAFRGSVTPGDWLRDTFATPYADRDLGPVHHGFYLGLRNVWADMQPLLRGGPVVLTGHSLGAARAAIMSGIMVSFGRPPAARIVFGEPKPGFQQLADVCKIVPTKSFRNGCGINHDVVTDLPLTVPVFGLHYVRQGLVTPVDVDPDPDDQSGVFTYHHIHLYLKAMQTLEGK